MTPSFFKRIVPHALQVAAISIIAFGISGCGGGGGSGDDSEPTIRPKTLDGIILQIDTEVRFEFIKNLSSPAALKSGEQETGTFIYEPLFAATIIDEKVTQHRTYENLAAGRTLTAFPASIAIASYTYRAINESSAVLTLVGQGASTFHFGHQIPFLNAGDPFGTPTNVVQIDLTFSSDGSNVSTNIVTFSLPESPVVSTLDTMRIPSKIGLAAGGSVPENYNPPVDLNRPSKIAPESLSGLLLTAKNGIPDSSKDFTIQFVKDAGYYGNPSDPKTPDEIGQGLLRVAGSAIDVALDYTYRRIGGTDNAELVLSNIPDNPLQPFNKSLNGSYTLAFLGKENGTYTGKVDGDTTDAADVSGTFSTLAN